MDTDFDQRGVAAHTWPDMVVTMAALPTTPIDKIGTLARQLSS
ncbi:hypothetical protein [Mycobacterium uberis]|nr:hypothetical protein [Mycobacterium uberis]